MINLRHTHLRSSTVQLNELLHNHLQGFPGTAYCNCVNLKAVMCSTVTPALCLTSGFQHKERGLTWHET